MSSNQSSQLTMGVLFIAVGLILLGQQLYAGWGLDMSRLWPVILLVVGAGQFSAPIEPGQSRRGLGLMTFGGVMLLHTTRILTVRQSWPLFIVAFGVGMLTRRGRRPRRPGGDL